VIRASDSLTVDSRQNSLIRAYLLIKIATTGDTLIMNLRLQPDLFVLDTDVHQLCVLQLVVLLEFVH
jgi:hypothetical protein